MLDDLRQRLRTFERPAALEDGATVLPLGVPEVGAVLGGGVSCGALHEVAAASEAHLPAATGFVAGIVRAACRQTVVWVAEDMGLAESGALYGPGLDGCGIPPERLLTVSVAHRRDLLWAMEEALHCRSVNIVVGEIRAGALDGIAVRRLSLAAADSGALALLLRAAPPADASTAATRWIVGAAPAPVIPGWPEGPDPASIRRSAADYGFRARGLTAAPRNDRGEAHFTARLLRNRRGPLGSWILTWSDDDGFAAHAQPLATPAADRPHRAVA
jgi:protein ImuA